MGSLWLIENEGNIYIYDYVCLTMNNVFLVTSEAIPLWL